MVEEVVLKNKNKIYALTSDCIIHLHELLTKNYHLVDKMDPVEPPGVKNIDALESAVSRQLVGHGDWLKYDTPFNNCATLVFGIIKNHPFHNGNKRVAFLTMLKHLFENGYVMRPDVKHDLIYKFLVALADKNFENEVPNIDKKLHKNYKKNKMD